MVRRWSCINELNKKPFQSYKSTIFTYNINTFKENVFFKKDIKKNSLLTRKSWSRRKHLFNWLFYQTVLINWSSDYRFFKNYNKNMLIQNTFKNSFFSYNFLLLKKTNSANFKYAENCLYSVCNRKIQQYFINTNLHTNSKNNFKNYSLFYLTQPTYKKETIESPLYNMPAIYRESQAQLYTPNLNNTQINYLFVVINLLHSITLSKNIALYQMFILLSLNNLF